MMRPAKLLAVFGFEARRMGHHEILS